MSKTEERVLCLVAGLVVGALLVLASLLLSVRVNKKPHTVDVEYKTVYDTVTISQPVEAYETPLGWDMVTLPVVNMCKDSVFRVHETNDMCKDSAIRVHLRNNLPEDTILSIPSNIGKDSVTVAIPLGQRTYEDSLYTAYVTGYRIGDYPRLDSITIRQRTEYVTRTVMAEQKRKSWSIGVGVGYGYTGKNFQPFLGATIQYKILEF